MSMTLYYKHNPSFQEIISSPLNLWEQVEVVELIMDIYFGLLLFLICTKVYDMMRKIPVVRMTRISWDVS